MCFASPHHVGAFEDVAGGLRKLLEPEVVRSAAPRSASRAARVEVEDGPGLSVFAARFGAGRVDRRRARRDADRRRLRDLGLARRAAGARHAADARRSVLVPGARLPRAVQRAGARAHGDRRAWRRRPRARAANRLVLDDRIMTERRGRA